MRMLRNTLQNIGGLALAAAFRSFVANRKAGGSDVRAQRHVHIANQVGALRCLRIVANNIAEAAHEANVVRRFRQQWMEERAQRDMEWACQAMEEMETMRSGLEQQLCELKESLNGTLEQAKAELATSHLPANVFVITDE